MAKTTRLLLVRHGETDDNRNLVFQGQLGLGLNDLGRRQAGLLAARLALAPDRPAVLVSSDLARARETAEILGAALGLSPTLDPGLREVYLGAWQGLSHAEIAARFPDEWAAWRAGRDIRRGGGETYAELAERVFRAVSALADAHPGRTSLVVSHGAALKGFVARVLGLASEGMRAFRVQANTGVTVVERDEARVWRLLVWNDEAHLHDPVLKALSDPPG
jgi:probable phosphoglycerate mutase